MKYKKIGHNPFSEFSEFQLSVETTESQKEILGTIRLDPEASLCFNESISLHLVGELNEAALKDALDKVITRHSALKSVFSSDFQHMMVLFKQQLDYSYRKFKTISNEEFKNKVAQVAQRETSEVFDLFKGPLIRFRLLRNNNQSVLIITAHHVICDGWSWASLLDEIGYYYSQNVQDLATDRELPYQYWQYALGLKDRSDELNAYKKYWVNIYSKRIPVLDLPLSYKRKDIRTYNSKRFDYKISKDFVRKLKVRARKEGVSFYSLLYSAYVLLLHKLTYDQDITVGISAAAQSILGEKNLIGHCVNLLPIRNIVTPVQSYRELLKNTSKNILDAFDHQELTFGALLKELPIDRDPARIPLVSTIFNIDLQPPGQGLSFYQLEASFVTNPREYENFEIFINATVCGDDVVIENQYNSDLFSASVIKKWMESYEKILEVVEESSDITIGEIDLSLQVETFKQVETESSSSLCRSEKCDPDVLSKISTIWKNLLGCKTVLPEDNFFHLGGHSLLAGEMMVAMQKEFKVSVTLKDIFFAQSLLSLAKTMTSRTGDTQAEEKLLVVEHDSEHQHEESLSVQQFRTWYLQTINSDSTLFNLPSFYEFGLNINIEALKLAINYFVKMNPLTRASLVLKNNYPSLIISEHTDLDLTINESYEHFNDLFNHVKFTSQQSIDLSKQSLFSVAVYKTKDGKVFLYTLIHHLIWDGWCYDLYRDELCKLYEHFCGPKGSEPSLKKEITYFDYVRWQKSFLASTDVKSQKEYWSNTLSGALPVLQLPLDYPRPNKLNFLGKSLFMKWSEDEVLPLEKLARDNNTTLFNVLLLGFKILLYRYSGQRDSIVGTPVQGRNKDGLRDIIGFFASNIAIRSQINESESMALNLKNLSEIVTNSYNNSDLPFDDVVKDLKFDRDPSYTPIYQSFFMYQDATNRESEFSDVSFKSHPIERGACHTDLDFWARRDTDGMAGGFDFMVDLFKYESIEKIAQNFKKILNSMATNSNSTISELDYLSPQEKTELVTNLNSTKCDMPSAKTVHQLIEQNVDKNPNKICVESNGKTLTYQELDNRANQIAAFLIGYGITPNQLVGVAVNRSTDLLITILGIWKAGAGYVPLDPDFPEERLTYMIDHSKLKLIITNQEFKSRDAFFTRAKVYIDRWEDFESFPNDRIPVSFNIEHTCYVIYTSGSTGRPKGVQLSQRSVINFLESMKKTPGMTSDDVLCAITTLSFDISVLELYLPLICGAKVTIVNRETAIFGDQLMKVLEEQKVTIMQATPASWRLLIHSGWKGDSSFKSLCGGEPFPKDLAASLNERCGEVWNMYGPTETTVWSTIYKVPKDCHTIYIGRPIDNTTIYIFDDDMMLAPHGVIGNLFIGGKGLALGYLHRDDLTKKQFIANPLDESELIYNTGDLARYHVSGDIECLGRNDGQVKVRGYRIELGEIESVLSSYSGVQQQVVVVREDRPGDVRLVAYYIADKEYSEKLLRDHLLEKLPSYMVPSHFVKMKEFPMTLNEKIDRKSLPAISSAIEESRDVIDSEVISTSEQWMLDQWKKLLAVSEISLDDNFFDLGGYSLLSVELFGTIYTNYGVNLPLSTLFEHGTVRNLTALVDSMIGESNSLAKVPTSETTDQKVHDLETHSLVLMRKGTGGRPVFFFHGVGGNVLNYRILFKAIPADRPIYGLQSFGIDGESKMATSFKKMVEEYAYEIMQSFPTGPYCFIGGSMGGLIALEVGRFMKDQDEKIEKLIMFDTFGPSFNTEKYKCHSVPFVQRVKNSIQYRLERYVKSSQRILYRLLLRPLPHDLRFFFVEQNNFRLIHGHTIKPFDGNIILIRGAKTDIGRSADPLLGWDGIILGNVDIHYTTACHEDIIEDKNSRELLKQLFNK